MERPPLLGAADAPRAVDRMIKRFREIMTEVEAKYEALINAQAFTCREAPVGLAGQAGIYLFEEDGTPLYVGRTDNIRRRLAGHRHRSHNTATFAFLLARRVTGNVDASYEPRGSRADLLRNNARFADAFDEARTRIGEMKVRVVLEADPVRQALLEVYAAYVCAAEFNDFRNH